MEDIDNLLSKAREMDEQTQLFQTEVENEVSQDQIRLFVDRYQNWYAKCMSILPEEAQEDFESHYESNWRSPGAQAFLSAPLKRNLFFQPTSDKSLVSPWQYPYDRYFHGPLLEQQRILRQHRAMPRGSGGRPSSSEGRTYGQRVFIGHGHNEIVRHRVKSFIAERCKLEAVVIEERASEGMTIIEKLEEWGNKCDFAVLILTADDFPENGKGRARQNVIYELGWFHATLGRSRTVILIQDGVETFSDIDGVIYQRFTENGVEIVFERLRQEFEAAGIMPA